MTYVGQQPATTFDSGIHDRFTGTTGTTVTLSNDIATENDIIVFVNAVKQDSNNYSVGGTGNKTLTLGGTLVSADIVEVHYLNKVLQSVNPTAGSVGLTELSATGTASGSNFLRGDNSWAAAGGDISFGGDTFGENKVIGANDAYSLSLETGGNTAITIDANGHVTMPRQSSFCATLSGTQSNLAIDNSTVWIEAATEIWDLNGDYNNSTYTFTAPVTGKYHLHARLQMLSTDQAGANQLVFYTSNVNNIWMESFSANMHHNDGQRHYHGSVIMDMDANDTAKIRFYQGGGTSQADVNDGQAVSAFSGYLIH